MATGKTAFERHGGFPHVSEQFNTVSFLEITSSNDGQLPSMSGYAFCFVGDPDNDGNVLLGHDNNPTFPLAPGAGLTLLVENLNQVWCDVPSDHSLHIVLLSEE